ncbi:MAG: glycosyltransferase family 4 protein [Planctomycetes bacterium]|nr:glycosyltransferase family 4 protein [Planctomycetota bacterium]
MGILFAAEGYDVSRPSMVMGRRVAGAEFLRALFRHGTWDRLVVFGIADSDLAILQQLMAAAGLPAKSSTRPVDAFQIRALPRLLHEGPTFANFFAPGPGVQGIAAARDWVRPGSFAITGVTYTLSTYRCFDALRANLLCPTEPWDTLVAISTAAKQAVEEFLDHTEAYVLDRCGAIVPRAFGVRVIPLGVDTDQYRPATTEERAAARAGLNLPPESPVLLWIGRLAMHEKAHPVPLFLALAQAAARLKSKEPIRLLLAGACDEQQAMQIFKQYQQLAARLCPAIRLQVFPNVDEPLKRRLLAAADVFVAPVDSIQETFGISLAEAMAAGLPIVAPDWDGFRDLVVPGVTGLLVESYLVRESDDLLTGAASTGLCSERMVHAWSSQLTAFHTGQLTKALIELLSNAQRRQAMGVGARRRAELVFDWREVIRQYEELWEESTRRREAATVVPRNHRFWAFPPPSSVFACFPSRVLGREDVVKADARSVELLRLLHAQQECNPLSWMLVPLPVLEEMLRRATAGGQIADWVQVALTRGVPAPRAFQSVAWLLKFGCLEPAPLPKGRKTRRPAPVTRPQPVPPIEEAIRTPVRGTLHTFLEHLAYCFSVLRGESQDQFSPEGQWRAGTRVTSFPLEADVKALLPRWYDLVEKYAQRTPMIEPRELIALGAAIHYWPGPVLEIRVSPRLLQKYPLSFRVSGLGRGPIRTVRTG